MNSNGTQVTELDGLLADEIISMFLCLSRECVYSQGSTNEDLWRIIEEDGSKSLELKSDGNAMEQPEDKPLTHRGTATNGASWQSL